MNVFGFEIESSICSDIRTYLIFADNIETARNLMQKEKAHLLSNKKDRWLWGSPIITELSNVREIKNANIIWQE